MDTVEKVEIKITDVEKRRLERYNARPPLSEILNLHDFEVYATSLGKVISSQKDVLGNSKSSHDGKGMGLLFVRR